MAWIKCPECGKPTSNTSPTCMNCGKTVRAEEARQVEEPREASEETKAKLADVASSAPKNFVKKQVDGIQNHWCKICLGISCFTLTCFGAVLWGTGGLSASETLFFHGAMISSAIMVHLFASILFGTK